MNPNNWINMLWMQGLWFGAVIGAAQGLLWLAPVLLMGFAFWEFRPVRRVYGDFQLMLVAVLIGLILDTTWVRLGWLEFAAGWALSGRAPLWILLLWAGLALGDFRRRLYPFKVEFDHYFTHRVCPCDLLPNPLSCP
jgi:hypothetical protein